jgi:hypothetical protein
MQMSPVERLLIRTSAMRMRSQEAKDQQRRWLEVVRSIRFVQFETIRRNEYLAASAPASEKLRVRSPVLAGRMIQVNKTQFFTMNGEKPCFDQYRDEFTVFCL